jgi:hypothetical protein
MSAPNLPAKRKTSPLVWILAAIAGIVVIFGLLLVAGGIFIFTKAKQAGLDPDLMRENPALAVAKMVAAVNPDVDIVDVDEGEGLITLRDKKSGKTVTVDFEQLKQGKISFESDEGERVTLEAEGEGDVGSLRVESPEGTFQYGAASSAEMPGWMPAYPGAGVEGIMSSQTPEGRGGAFSFTTSHPVEQVMKFYAEGLERAGLEVTTVHQGGREPGGIVRGADEERERNAMVIIGTDSDGTTVNVTFAEKN